MGVIERAHYACIVDQDLSPRMRKTAPDAPQMDASSFTSSFTTCNFARDLRADAESGFLHVAKTSLEGSEVSCLTISKPMPRSWGR